MCYITFELLSNYFLNTSRAWLFVFNTRSSIYSKCKSPFTPKSVINKPQAEGKVNYVCTVECRKTSQVTYVTMVPRVGNETLRPLGVATGNASSVTRVWRYICKNTTCWPATAHDVTTGVSQYKCRREHTSSASSSEACVRSMAQSLGDAVSRSPLGEPWLHT